MSLGSRGRPEERLRRRSSSVAAAKANMIAHGHNDVNSSTTIATSRTKAVASAINSSNHEAVSPNTRPVTAAANIRTRVCNDCGGPSGSRGAGSRHVQKRPGLRG